MKKAINLAGAMLSLALVAACDDFLTKIPEAKLDAGTFFSTRSRSNSMQRFRRENDACGRDALPRRCDHGSDRHAQLVAYLTTE